MNDKILFRNNVNISGNGIRPMIFAHGFGCDQNMWRYITAAFEKDFKIILFDFAGHGKSDISAYHSEKYANLNGYAQDLLDVCNELQLKETIFVGHSVSCMSGILAAIKVPHLFSNMILIAPSPRYINDPPEYKGGFEKSDIEGLLQTMEKNYIGWANFLGSAIMQNPGKPELARELTDSFCSTDPTIARQFAEVTFFSDNRKDLPKITVPSLIIQCTDDLLAPVEVGKYMLDHMPGSTLKVINATGHCPHMSAPDETIDAINAYLHTRTLN